jgi:hypothetical protein
MSNAFTMPVCLTILLDLMTDSLVSKPRCQQSSFTSRSFSSVLMSDEAFTLKYLYLMSSVIRGFRRFTNLSEISFSPASFKSRRLMSTSGPPEESLDDSSHFLKACSEMEISLSRVSVEVKS